MPPQKEENPLDRAICFFPEYGIKVNVSEHPDWEPGRLARTFVIPPFSVLNARDGVWQERKQMWLSLGIQSELGRGANLTADGGSSGWAGNRGSDMSPGGAARPACSTKDGKTQRGDGHGRPLARTFGSGKSGGLSEFKKKSGDISGGGAGCFLRRHEDGYEAVGQKYKQSASGTGGVTVGVTRDAYRDPDGETTAAQGSGTSIFDPVLCELSYRWFCPVGGNILDPFAGGSVRGIVASVLGFDYTGIDLSAGQIESNRQQARDIVPQKQPTWVVGDSANVRKLVQDGQQFDLVFSCPPYGSLERYSDDPADLSTMTDDGFLEGYRRIIKKSLSLLKDDRFAIFVIGDVRGKDHFYTHLPQYTIQAFEDCGAMLYNEAVLVTAVGSLPLRTRKQFASYRKLGHTHQYVQFFIKGDYKKACKAINSKP